MARTTFFLFDGRYVLRPFQNTVDAMNHDVILPLDFGLFFEDTRELYIVLH